MQHESMRGAALGAEPGTAATMLVDAVVKLTKTLEL